MELLKKWDATNFVGVLASVAIGGHFEAMKLLEKWRAA